jgi:hypothetical protein
VVSQFVPERAVSIGNQFKLILVFAVTLSRNAFQSGMSKIDVTNLPNRFTEGSN